MAKSVSPPAAGCFGGSGPTVASTYAAARWTVSMSSWIAFASGCVREPLSRSGRDSLSRPRLSALTPCPPRPRPAPLTRSALFYAGHNLEHLRLSLPDASVSASVSRPSGLFACAPSLPLPPCALTPVPSTVDGRTTASVPVLDAAASLAAAADAGYVFTWAAACGLGGAFLLLSLAVSLLSSPAHFAGRKRRRTLLLLHAALVVAAAAAAGCSTLWSIVLAAEVPASTAALKVLGTGLGAAAAGAGGGVAWGNGLLLQIAGTAAAALAFLAAAASLVAVRRFSAASSHLAYLAPRTVAAGTFEVTRMLPAPLQEQQRQEQQRQRRRGTDNRVDANNEGDDDEGDDGLAARSDADAELEEMAYDAALVSFSHLSPTAQARVLRWVVKVRERETWTTLAPVLARVLSVRDPYLARRLLVALTRIHSKIIDDRGGIDSVAAMAAGARRAAGTGTLSASASASLSSAPSIVQPLAAPYGEDGSAFTARPAIGIAGGSGHLSGRRAAGGSTSSSSFAASVGHQAEAAGTSGASSSDGFVVPMSEEGGGYSARQGPGEWDRGEDAPPLAPAPAPRPALRAAVATPNPVHAVVPSSRERTRAAEERALARARALPVPLSSAWSAGARWRQQQTQTQTRAHAVLGPPLPTTAAAGAPGAPVPPPQTPPWVRATGTGELAAPFPPGEQYSRRAGIAAALASLPVLGAAAETTMAAAAVTSYRGTGTGEEGRGGGRTAMPMRIV
jgi:hypothetical protein